MANEVAIVDFKISKKIHEPSDDIRHYSACFPLNANQQIMKRCFQDPYFV